MKGLREPLAAIALLLAVADDASSAAIDVLRALDGDWRGAGFSLTIDSARAQARLDPKKPFQWEAFNIRNIEGRMVVFSVGAQLFIGYLDEDRLTVTTPGRQDSWSLARAR